MCTEETPQLGQTGRDARKVIPGFVDHYYCVFRDLNSKGVIGPSLFALESVKRKQVVEHYTVIVCILAIFCNLPTCFSFSINPQSCEVQRDDIHVPSIRTH
jgi:hypothetical protein